MTNSLKPLKMRPGTVCPAYLFGAEVRAAGGTVLATFTNHGHAFRALALADGRDTFNDWRASMSDEDMAKICDVNAYLASQAAYAA